MSLSAIQKTVWVVFSANTRQLQRAVSELDRRMGWWAWRLGMSLWGVSFGLRIIGRSLSEAREKWIDSFREMEMASLRLKVAVGLSSEKLKALAPVMEEISETQLWSRSDIELGMAYLKQIGLTNEEIERLSGILQGASILQGSFAEASRIVAEWIERGNASILKQIGLVVSANAIKEYAIATLGKEYNELSELEKARLRYNFLLERGATLELVASEYSTTTASAMQKLKVAVKDLYATLGEALAPTLTKLIQHLTNFIKTLQEAPPWVQRTVAVFTLLGSVFGSTLASALVLSSSVISLSMSWQMLSPVVAGVLSKLTGLDIAMKGLMPTVIATQNGFSVLFDGMSSVTLIASQLLPLILALASAVTVLALSTEQGSQAFVSLLTQTTLGTHLFPELYQQMATINAIELKLDYTTKQLAEAQGELAQRTTELTNALVDVRSRLYTITEQLNKLENERLQIESRLESLNLRLQSLELQRAHALESLKNIMWEIAKIEGGMGVVVTERMRAEWRLQDALHRLEQANRRIQQAEYRVEQARRNLTRASWRQKDAEWDLRKARYSVQKATFDLWKAEWELFKLRREYEDIAKEVLFAENRLAIMRRRYGEESWEAYESELALRELLKQKEEAEMKVKEGEEKRTEAMMKLEEAQHRVEEAQRRMIEAAWAWKDAVQSIIEAQWELSDAYYERERAEREVMEAQQNRIEVEKRLEELQAKKEELLKKLEYYENQTKELLKKKNELENKRAETLAKINPLQFEYNQLVEEQKRLEEELRETTTNLTEKITALKDEVQRLNNRLDNLKESFKKAKQDIAKSVQGMATALLPAFFGIAGAIIWVIRNIENLKKAFNSLLTHAQNVANDLVEIFTSLYNQLVGHSIIPEMWEKILNISRRRSRELRKVWKEIIPRIEPPPKYPRFWLQPIPPKVSGTEETHVTVNFYVDRMTLENYQEIVDRVWRDISRRVRYERGVYA